MEPTLLPAVALLMIVALFLLSVRDPPSFWRQLRDHLDQLGNELDRHMDRERWARRMPVLSAPAVRGKEAQLMRERLSRKAPRARYVLLLLFAGAFAWWLTR